MCAAGCWGTNVCRRVALSWSGVLVFLYHDQLTNLFIIFILYLSFIMPLGRLGHMACTTASLEIRDADV
jgi:hypothetical protein